MPEAPTLVANARLYAATPDATAAWAELFGWVAARSGVALAVRPHPAPAPMAALRGRPDLGAAFMCGRPWTRAEPRPVPVAAPEAPARTVERLRKAFLAGGAESGLARMRGRLCSRASRLSTPPPTAR